MKLHYLTAGQFTHSFALVLWVAAALAFFADRVEARFPGLVGDITEKRGRLRHHLGEGRPWYSEADAPPL